MTTYTGYPDANPETTSVDGYAERSGVDQMWANIRAGAGTGSGDTDVNARCAWATGSATSGQFSRLRRTFLTFDTNSIPAGATINSATLTVTGTNKANGLGSPDLHVVGSAPASNTAIASGDYGNLSFTSFGSVSYAGFSTAGANVITLNASGLAAIVKAGITKLGLVLSWDQSGTFGGVWGSGLTSSFYINFADNGSAKPTLTVDYTTAGGARVQVVLV